jgi:hypothetical protein
MTVTAQPVKRQDRTTLVLLVIASLVAVGGIGFAVGHLTGGTSGSNNPNSGVALGGGRGNGGFNRPSLAPGQTLNPGQFAGGRGTGFGGISGGVTGTVQSVSGSSITVLLANGTTVTIDLSGTTTYHSETAATSGDVKTGSTVTVQIDTSTLANASPNPSASGGLGGRQLTAKDILINTP